MGISLGANRFLQKSTHTHTPTIPRVLIIRRGIKSLRFYMLKASKCSFLHVKALPSTFKSLLVYSPAFVKRNALSSRIIHHPTGNKLLI